MNINLIFYVQIGFILHFLGDYIFQSSWMANEKTKYFTPAAIHALIYSFPFMLITSPLAWLVVLITHFFIDRYRLAVYWVKLINDGWKSNNHGYPETTPVWLSTWLLFIVDNTFHIIINTSCIVWSNWK